MFRTHNRVLGFHAHVYFERHQEQLARTVCLRAERECNAHAGQLHLRPIGPHPMPSCQLSCNTEMIGALLIWLILNRQELTVFFHAVTGNGLRDHTENVFWLGQPQPIDLSIFSRDLVP